MNRPTRLLPGIAILLAVALIQFAISSMGPSASAADPEGRPGTTSLARYLETFALDREAREILDSDRAWGDDHTALVVRVLLRLMLAPPEFVETWQGTAVPIASLATKPEDALVHAVGSAVFVAELTLPDELARLAGRGSVELVRMRTVDGETIDVVTDTAPRVWPRWHDIDEPAEVFGLPVASGVGPTPMASAADGGRWPTPPPDQLLAAARVAWHPPRLPGSAGMDVGLLDTVVDGQKLTGGDTEAFYALLAAAGRAGEGVIAKAAGPPGSLIPLIDPADPWFERHRGEPIAIEGVALRATRIEIDDPLRQRQTGIDHYWEVFVFVNTPLISVGGKAQDRYPVVCCLRALPAGMPSGPTISEPIRVAGFALKSYAYPLRTADGTEIRREAPLLVGGDVAWQRPRTSASQGPLGWVLAALAATIVGGAALAVWTGRRDARRRAAQRRASLPDRFVPPGEGRS
jgi:hypothetical protein